MIEEALSLHIDGKIEDGEAVPEPNTLDEISKAEGYSDAVAVMAVKSPAIAEATVRVNITLPEKIFAQIDRKAAAQGMSRSGFLVEAAKRW